MNPTLDQPLKRTRKPRVKRTPSTPEPVSEKRPQAGITCGLPVVKRGLDTLRVSLWLEWENESLLEHLDEQKAIVQSTEDDVIPIAVDITYSWNLHRTGTSKFNFRLTSGDCILLLNKRKADGAIPNCRIEIGSISCWSPGYETVFGYIRGFLRGRGARIVKERVSEVHIAADFVGMDITSIDAHNMDRWIMKSTSYDLYYKHRRFSGLSVGKGDLMLRIYNKVLELKNQRATHKQEVFAEIWQVPKFDEKPVTRVEFQIRRPILREFSEENKEQQIDTVADLTTALPSLWKYLTRDWIRHTLKEVDRKNKNQSKAGISEFWLQVRNVVWTGLLEYIRNHPPKHKDIEGLRKQARGCLMSVCASLDIAPDDIDRIVSLCQELIEEDLHQYFSDASAFIEKMKIKRNEAISVLSCVVPF